MEFSSLSIAQRFFTFFDIAYAATPELLEHVYRIRGDVYCKEFKFEPEDKCADGLERDEYDDYSVHCLIMHREQNLPAGCVRLVMPPTDDPNFQLPMEKHCSHSFNHDTLDPRHMPRDRLVELSRLAVHTLFRRRAGEKASPLGEVEQFTELESRTFPLIASALIMAMISFGLLTQRPHGFSVMEPRLARRLTGSGFPLTQIGEPVEFHGLRAPFHITAEQAINGMKPELREIYDLVHERLSKDFERNSGFRRSSSYVQYA